MEKALLQYGFPVQEFDKLMHSLKQSYYYAGSFTLQQYSQAQFPPNDLDIWVDYEVQDFKSSDDAYALWVEEMKDHIDTFMKDHGFCRSSMEQIDNNPDSLQTADVVDLKDYFHSGLNKRMLFIHSYVNEKGRVVQFLFFRTIDKDASFLKDFDLSCCAVAWNPTEGFKCSPPQALKDAAEGKFRFWRETLASGTEQPSRRNLKRVEKYKQRGFTFVESIQ